MSGPRTTRTRTVMDLLTCTTVMDRLPGVGAGRVLFREDLGGEPGVARSVTFSSADWTDMGAPSTVTVTVTPGNTFNTKEGS